MLQLSESQQVALDPMSVDEATRKKYLIISEPSEFHFIPSDDRELQEGEIEYYWTQINPFTGETQVTRTIQQAI